MNPIRCALNNCEGGEAYERLITWRMGMLAQCVQASRGDAFGVPTDTGE